MCLAMYVCMYILAAKKWRLELLLSLQSTESVIILHREAHAGGNAYNLSVYMVYVYGYTWIPSLIS